MVSSFSGLSIAPDRLQPPSNLPMPLTTIEPTWSSGADTTLPDLCGPVELAEVLLRIVEQERQADRHLIASETGVQRLVQLAYAASLLEEEGRFPRFRIASRTAPLRCTVQFDPPIVVDTIGTLRRLAPAVSRRERALYITEDEAKAGRLICPGIVDLGQAFDPLTVGVPDSLIGHDKSMLMVGIEGPGHVSLSAFDYGYVLRGYTIRRLAPYIAVEPVYQLFSGLALAVLAQRAPSQNAYRFFTPATGPWDIAAIWSDVLHAAMMMGHGGAFIILPEMGAGPIDVREQYGIDIYCHTGLDLGAAIAEFADACERVHELVTHSSQGPPASKAGDELRRELKRATDQWLKQRTAVRNAASMLANLSAVDGCVVLDRRLRVLGFGGIITQHASPRLPLRHWPREGDSFTAPSCRHLGTRHRSACGLCCQHPYAFAFVVSQDGDLRVFCSDSEHAYGFEGLDVWPGISTKG